MIDDEGLAWIEAPIVYDNLDGYAQLAAELKTPIQIGENFYGPRDLHMALQRKACDLVMPDFMRIGGGPRGPPAPPAARGAGLPSSAPLFPEGGAPCSAAPRASHCPHWTGEVR